tara:strand:- start:188 stop:973 length:786 start_codon:yes stop_codon:yes gene_type:complete
MQVSSVNVSPETANHMLVSLNGVLQAPGSSYTVSGSTITFASNLVTGDVINFIHILGSVLDLGVPSDDTVTLAKLASGTDGNLISYDTSGNPVAVATGSSGQVLTSAGAGAVPSFQSPAGGGKILQVVSVTNQQATSTSSATFGDVTGVTAAITPSATSSKVLVMMNSIFRVVNAGTYGYFTMLRGSTNLSGDAGFLTARDGSSSGTNTYGQIAMTHVDSPNTTSETTYKMQSRSTSGEVIVNASSTDARSTVILMEIDGS